MFDNILPKVAVFEQSPLVVFLPAAQNALYLLLLAHHRLGSGRTVHSLLGEVSYTDRYGEWNHLLL